MCSSGPLHMAYQKQDDLLEHSYSSYVMIRDVTPKTCRRRWMIERRGERGSGVSVLAAREDDEKIWEILCQLCWSVKSSWTFPGSFSSWSGRELFRRNFNGFMVKSLAMHLHPSPPHIYIYIYSVCVCMYVYTCIYHHHHYFAPSARISLTLSRHSSLLARPCEGVHRSTSLTSSSLQLQQCPACLVRLTLIVFVMGGCVIFSYAVSQRHNNKNEGRLL